MSKDRETCDVPGMHRTVERIDVGFLQENPSKTLPVQQNDTMIIESPGYERCRFQIEARRVYFQSPSPTPPSRDLAEMLLRGDYFDRADSQKLVLPDSGVLEVPLYRKDEG